ncbi:F-box protein PP2-B10-like [Panicum miliaceum]|uniref:F-box protein PP2-B10-like n=1 Tax=Panicum miliaceum TaxID=4540 RepID=A0A3L6RSH0_PANMI|nr:F-box protein PP2-B10-like [Panicum miliaceum]
METAAAESGPACEIARLPEELLSVSIACAAPRDACRAAAVSPAFRAAADSDAVWACFVPREVPPFADGELSPAPPSKKALFMQLCDSPVLLADGLTSMWLDRETGAKCYMLSARALCIIWGDTPKYWRWIPITGSRFSEAAELLQVWWFEIRGKIDSKMLSRNSTYAAYIVFRVAPGAYGLGSPYPETSVSLGGSKSACHVCLDVSDRGDEDSWWTLRPSRRSHLEIPPNVLLPQERGDGWMELEMGEFHNDEGEDGEVSISLMETSATIKIGLAVQGIEIRPKKKRALSL